MLLPWTYVINDLNREEIVTKTFELLTKKDCKKKKKKKLKKKSREKVINYTLNEKDIIICLIAGQIKKTQYK